MLKIREPENWKYDASSKTYYNEIPVPEIDDTVVQKAVSLFIQTQETAFLFNYREISSIIALITSELRDIHN